MLFDRKDFDPVTHTGVCAEDCKMIMLALSQHKTLRIDGEGRIYDNTGRYIADGKERG
ncbi:MAG: hypothetical protein J6X60_01825 [Ruminiclostridium sp.]|nr:hypothetical protein [Ruminiclostridium sp.]